MFSFAMVWRYVFSMFHQRDWFAPSVRFLELSTQMVWKCQPFVRAKTPKEISQDNYVSQARYLQLLNTNAIIIFYSRYQQPQSYYSQPAYEPEPAYRHSYRPSYLKPISSFKPKSYYTRPEPAYEPEPDYRPEPVYRPEPAYRPAPSYRPSYTPPPPPPPPQPSYRPQSNFGFSNNNNNYYSQPSSYNNGFANVDWYTGSYSVNYKR